ncbi:MAG: hypothetical protein V1902_03335 [Candidatus Falkowbacteria bacterium]
MEHKILQFQYDKIYAYFKTTCEWFDFLEWDGKILNIWSQNKIIEIYKHGQLKSLDIFTCSPS